MDSKAIIALSMPAVPEEEAATTKLLWSTKLWSYYVKYCSVSVHIYLEISIRNICVPSMNGSSKAAIELRILREKCSDARCVINGKKVTCLTDEEDVD